MFELFLAKSQSRQITLISLSKKGVFRPQGCLIRNYFVNNYIGVLNRALFSFLLILKWCLLYPQQETNERK